MKRIVFREGRSCNKLNQAGVDFSLRATIVCVEREIH